MLKSPPRMKCWPSGSASASARMRCASSSRRASLEPPVLAFMCEEYSEITPSIDPYPTSRTS